jgi:hypothetical protein
VRNRNVYALLLVVAILVAVASLYLLVTSRPPGEGSAEAGFARNMTAHHAQAVEMAEIEAPLTPLEANAEGRGSSTTVVQNATVDGLFSGESEYVNVHAAGSGSPPAGLREPQPRRVADYTSRRDAMSHPHAHGHSHDSAAAIPMFPCPRLATTAAGLPSR